jgi:hypothetical protein
VAADRASANGEVGGVSVVDVHGRITVGKGNIRRCIRLRRFRLLVVALLQQAGKPLPKQPESAGTERLKGFRNQRDSSGGWQLVCAGSLTWLLHTN